jgi:diketogulonate reductase-like aldo/keto reductase
LHPQTELLEYCKKEGIILQAYASLGGQDTGQEAWKKLLGVPVQQRDDDTSDTKSKRKKAKASKLSLINSELVRLLSKDLTESHGFTITPAQVLLRWGLEKGAALIPKTKNKDRMVENIGVFNFKMSKQQVNDLENELRDIVRSNNPDSSDLEEVTRLCWRSDPLRHLNFE